MFVNSLLDYKITQFKRDKPDYYRQLKHIFGKCKLILMQVYCVFLKCVSIIAFEICISI